MYICISKINNKNYIFYIYIYKERFVEISKNLEIIDIDLRIIFFVGSSK